MIELSTEAKQAYAKYVGPDGRLIIDESLPDNIKNAFKYFNDNDINILELNMERPSIDESDDESQIDYDDDSDDLDFGEEVESEYDEGELSNNDSEFDETPSTNIDDLFSDL